MDLLNVQLSHENVKKDFTQAIIQQVVGSVYMPRNRYYVDRYENLVNKEILIVVVLIFEYVHHLEIQLQLYVILVEHRNFDLKYKECLAAHCIINKTFYLINHLKDYMVVIRVIHIVSAIRQYQSIINKTLELDSLASLF